MSVLDLQGMESQAPKGGHDGVAHYVVKSMSQLRRLLETYTP